MRNTANWPLPLKESVEWLTDRIEKVPEVAVVLGSGLGGLADALEDLMYWDYNAIPHMPVSKVAGHRGRLVCGTLLGEPLLVLQGRAHAYEGHTWDDVVFGLRSVIASGVKVVVLTNAAGGINARFQPGHWMLLRDHINLTGGNCLAGSAYSGLGPAFVDMSAAYSPVYRQSAQQVASRLGIAAHQGVYAGLLGPSYETPAEIDMLRTLGADAVGMSTVQECLAARHMGATVVGISCITNLAAGISAEALSHAEVQAIASSESSVQALVAWLSGCLPIWKTLA